MTKRVAYDLAAIRMAQFSPTRTLEPYNFKAVDVPRPLRDPEWVIRGGSTMADMNKQAVQLLLEANRELRVDLIRPIFLALARVAENPNEIVATPVAKAAENTLQIAWSPDMVRAKVNVRLFLKAERFSVSPRTSVHIPVTLERIPGVGLSQVLHLNRLYTVPMADRPVRTEPAAPVPSDFVPVYYQRDPRDPKLPAT